MTLLRTRILVPAFLFLSLLPAAASNSLEPAEVAVFNSPTCGCCSKWTAHLKSHGFVVQSHAVSDVTSIKEQYGVPRALYACHTALVAGYVVEGHVPARDIRRLLREKPAVVGLAVPGMPRGSPGMEAPVTEPYEVLVFDDDGRTSVFARY